MSVVQKKKKNENCNINYRNVCNSNVNYCCRLITASCFFESPCITVLCVNAVRKRELGASCEMSDVCRDDNAHCTTSNSISSSSTAGTSTCQCTDTFYQTADVICSKRLDRFLM